MKNYNLILVDGSSYLFRAYHALPPLTNSDGMPTGAVYGVINMLKKLIAQYPSEHIAVIFDTKGKTFRHKMYPEYKANRPEMPEELAVQIEPLHNLIKALGVPLIAVPGVEADDVIGTLAVQAQQQGLTTLISTGDKDMAQLVNDQVTLINTMNDKTMDIAGVEEKFGVKPEQIIDYLTLMGDTVDNVPGVPKVGPKTAAKWLNQYNSLDNIIAHQDEFKGKIGEYLREAIPSLRLSKDLVTIKCDVPLDFDFASLTMQQADTPELKQTFAKLEFNAWARQLDKEQSGNQADKTENQYTTIFDQGTFNEWLKKLTQAKTFSFDTETTSLNAMEAQVVGLSFADQAGNAAYVPLTHSYLGAPEQLDKAWALAQLKPLLSDKQYTVVGQNLKYDYKVLRNEGIEITATMRDTMLESYVLNSSAQRHDLDTLALKYLGVETVHFEDIAGKGKKQLRFDQIDIDKAAPYAAEDADIALQLDQQFLPKINKDADLAKVFAKIEEPLLPVLANMEYTGVLLDCTKLAKQGQFVEQQLQKLEKEIYKISGEEFNIASTKQLGAIFYDKLKLPVLKKTPKGQPSTAEPVLQELALDYPLPKHILEYRSLAKLKSTYIDALPQQVNPKTGRIHTVYRQAVTSTGRLSSTDPNLQNIPVRTEQGRKIREAFIAPQGYKIISADYSQIELRIMAHLSKDKGLLDAFTHGLDVHSATAAEVLGKKIEDISPTERRSAKAVNFGLIYGMSAFGLAKQLGIDRAAAQDYIDKYFARYPGVKQYMEQTRELAHQQGYVQTCFGRKLFLPDINSSNHMTKMGAERAAINAPMQGTAADIIKLAMLDVDAWLKQGEVNAQMIMQVHDELVFEVAEDQVEHAKAQIKSLMEKAFQLDVPLIVEVGVGDNWEEAH